MDIKNSSISKVLRVSVAIPAFNEEKDLPHLLESLAKQTVKPFEILVADNNSTDKTAEIAKASGAIVVPIKRQGNVYAMQGGVAAAQGDVIACIDADTIASPDWIESIISIFEDNKVLGATGLIVTGKSISSKISDWLYYLFLQINFWIGIPHLVGFNTALRRSAVEAVGGIDLNYTMSCDVELGLRLSKHGKVVLAKEMIVNPSMRRWDNSVTKTLIQYGKGYLYTVILRKPVPFKQEIVR